ncbi:Carboxylyase-related protein, partial [mine drainage metagenome]
LESRQDLIRVRTPVSRDLEIAEVTQRVIAARGPALLFEQVSGAKMPVVTNLLGTAERIAFGIGDARLDDTAARIAKLTRLKPPAGLVGALKDLGGTIELLGQLRSLAPKRVSSAPAQEVEEPTVDLDRLPILRCWPKGRGPDGHLPDRDHLRPGDRRTP